MLLIAPLLFLCMLFAGGPRQTRGQEADRRTDRSRREMLERLASGGEEQRIDSLVRICALLRDEPDAIETPVITSIGDALQRDSSPVVRALAARALETCAGNLGAGQGDVARSTLLASLGKEREVAVLKAIIYALARYPQPQVTSALIPFLKKKRSELRAAAAYALAEIGDPDTAQALAELLRQRRGRVRTRPGGARSRPGRRS